MPRPRQVHGRVVGDARRGARARGGQPDRVEVETQNGEFVARGRRALDLRRDPLFAGAHDEGAPQSPRSQDVGEPAEPVGRPPLGPAERGARRDQNERAVPRKPRAGEGGVRLGRGLRRNREPRRIRVRLDAARPEERVVVAELMVRLRGRRGDPRQEPSPAVGAVPDAPGILASQGTSADRNEFGRSQASAKRARDAALASPTSPVAVRTASAVPSAR